MKMQSLNGAWVSRSLAILLVVGAVGASAPTASADATIVQPSATVLGKGYGDWSAAWWQWILSVPTATNPQLDATGADCAQRQSGQMWFLAGTFGGSATRSCTVPAGKYIMFPILNNVYVCFRPTDPDPNCSSVAAMRAAIAGSLDNPTKLNASIDGANVGNLLTFRAQSPVFTAMLPQGNLFGIQQGAYRPAVSDGYWLILQPLSPGSHTIRFEGVENNGFSVDATYNLTIAP